MDLVLTRVRVRLQLRSLHQMLGADGTLSLYTSPSLPNISLGLPANTHIPVGEHSPHCCPAGGRMTQQTVRPETPSLFIKTLESSGSDRKVHWIPVEVWKQISILCSQEQIKWIEVLVLVL